MSQVLFNQLSYVGKLEASGFDARQARGAAEALGDAFTQAVATKSDISELKSELKGDIAELKSELKGDIAELKSELKGDIAELKSELKGDIAELKSELKGDIAELKIDIARTETKFEKSLREQTFKSVSLIGGLLAIFTVISHYWK